MLKNTALWFEMDSSACIVLLLYGVMSRIWPVVWVVKLTHILQHSDPQQNTPGFIQSNALPCKEESQFLQQSSLAFRILLAVLPLYCSCSVVLLAKLVKPAPSSVLNAKNPCIIVQHDARHQKCSLILCYFQFPNNAYI